MTGESIPVYGTTVNMITSGASRLNTEFSVVGDVANDYVGDHDICDLVFEGTFASAPAANQTLKIYMRKMNSKGTNDDGIPDANFEHTFVANIPLDTTATNTITKPKVPILKDCQLYIKNLSGQTLNTGWTLDVKPFGYAAAP